MNSKSYSYLFSFCFGLCTKWYLKCESLFLGAGSFLWGWDAILTRCGSCLWLLSQLVCVSLSLKSGEQAGNGIRWRGTVKSWWMLAQINCCDRQSPKPRRLMLTSVLFTSRFTVQIGAWWRRSLWSTQSFRHLPSCGFVIFWNVVLYCIPLADGERGRSWGSLKDFFFFFKGSSLEVVCTTYYWPEPNPMIPPDCKGGWER